MTWLNKKVVDYILTPDSVYMCNGLSKTLICDAIDIHSRICIDIPMMIPQRWVTLKYSDFSGKQKQAIVLDCMLGEDKFWSLLGDLYEDDFIVHRGQEDALRDYLLRRLAATHEFRLCQAMPTQSVYLSDNRPGWGTLYDNFNRSAVHAMQR